MLVLAFKLLQTPRETVILTEIASPPRQIYTDGRPLPKNLDPTWMGYSIGKWEGDTFVVHTTGLNERGWLDALGHPRSEQMQITERYLRPISGTWTSSSRSTIRCTTRGRSACM